MHTKEEIKLFHRARMKLPVAEQLRISETLAKHPELLPKMVDNFLKKYNAIKSDGALGLEKVIDEEYKEFDEMIKEVIKED